MQAAARNSSHSCSHSYPHSHSHSSAAAAATTVAAAATTVAAAAAVIVEVVRYCAGFGRHVSPILCIHALKSSLSCEYVLLEKSRTETWHAMKHTTVIPHGRYRQTTGLFMNER